MNNNFLYGIIFAILFLPICESVVDLTCSAIEVLKSKFAVSIAKANYRISNMEEGNSITHAIGFQAPEKSSEYEDD